MISIIVNSTAPCRWEGPAVGGGEVPSAVGPSYVLTDVG